MKNLHVENRNCLCLNVEEFFRERVLLFDKIIDDISLPILKKIGPYC